MERRRFSNSWWLAVSAALALVLSGCPKRIGDGCTTNIECSLNADRRCDLAQPGGYCTVPECDPDRCPDQAMCVEFDSNAPRLARRFCMKTCNQDGDCRDGFTCAHPTVLADGTCPTYDPTTQASFPVCHRLLDVNRTHDMPTGYCIERGTAMSSTTSDAGDGSTE